ncbi:MAG: sulfatase-like hydrolase/transferase [Myxococcales bacterium]
MLVAGACLASFELVRVLGWGRSLFLSSLELGRYALAAWTALSSLVLLLGLPLRWSTRADYVGFRARIGVALVSLLAGGWAGWLLTEGRRVRDLAARPLLALGIAVLIALMVVIGMRTATFVRTQGALRPAVAWALACAVVAATALVVDGAVLPRGYPAFHWLLLWAAALSATLAAVGFPRALLPKADRRVRWGSALVAITAPLSMVSLAHQSNASYAVSESAPFTAKLLAPVLRSVGRRRPNADQDARGIAVRPEKNAPAAPQARGINLQDKDVLLITVDALRADVLKAYGGTGVTPKLDELAQQSMVFRRAYTPAPHTSYALASLLTAKFMKPVLELPGAERDHPTLPDLLRRYGYRTAAFYPPAIFFVDGANFDLLRGRGFGFEYRKEMFASAAQRVSQLEAYLNGVDRGHPLFIWVHLFEPHEPYEPAPEFVTGDSPRARYDGEVRTCDRSIAELVRVFRAAHPDGTVIVTADHGEEFGEHGGSYHGTTLYDEQVRVPLLWSSPGQVSPGVSDAPVELVDVGTTLLSAAGVPREARMRGDDLGAVLNGFAEAGPQVAFASVEQRHMATDGRLKVVCMGEQEHCQLFDLETDPPELKNEAPDRPLDVERLRGEIDRFVSTIPRTEALAVANGVGFPEALARAKLGVTGVGPELVPLLADARPAVRAAAARGLGELHFLPALPMLVRLGNDDADLGVRAEAAISALQLGSREASSAVLSLLVPTPAHEASAAQRDLVRRAALALAQQAHPEALPALGELALDESAAEGDRVRAIAALGDSRSPQAVDSLLPLLADVRLREPVADALGKLGGNAARSGLAKALGEERYEPARRAEARALLALRDRRVVPLVLRYLGMESSIPDGIRILMAEGALGPSSRYGSVLSDGARRKGSWTCADYRCVPGADAELSLPPVARPSQSVRVTWLVDAQAPGARLELDGGTLSLRAGEQQVSVLRPAREATHFKVRVQGEARLIAVVAALAQPEIPAPEAEPWDAGASSDAGDDAGVPSVSLHSP